MAEQDAVHGQHDDGVRVPGGALPAGRVATNGWIMWGGLVLLAIVPLAVHLAGDTFWLSVFTRLVILAIAAVSLNLVLGYGGLVSFGHAAFLGIGAYAVGIPVHHATMGGFESIATSGGLFHIMLAVFAAAFFALVTGAISLRTRGVHFIMITMAFGQMMFFAIVSIEAYGGDDGLTIYERSTLPGISLDNPLALYGLSYGSLLVALYVVHRIVNSRFGMVLRAAKGNEERIRALGFNAYAYRLLAYVISGAMCGYAGALLGNFTTFISPEMMDWTRSGELMFMVILGGAGALFGPVIGASIFLLLEEVLGRITIYWHLPFGVLLILAVLFLKGGVSGFADRFFGGVAVGEPLLEVDGLRKRFGGVRASDDVSLTVLQGETHAIIGPNGAGKTTLIAQLSGQLQPDEGRIYFEGRDITRLAAYQRAHVGITRSFQITSVFMDMTLHDNVALAVQAHRGHSFRLWRPAAKEPELRALALHYLARVGLAGRAGLLASQLSHGERRQLEMAMALAGEPKLMLLDEPMAGMGAEESQQMIELLKSLRGQTILLVEHDMDAVFALADRISVMVYGRVIASGSPPEIRNDAEVRRAYLGEAG